MSVKKYFKSRWGNDGYIIEADFSQLEIIGAAVLSGDKQLKEDLRSGKDLHCVSTTMLYPLYTYKYVYDAYKAGDPEMAKKRKKAKVASFQLQYGSGAANMSASAGISVEDAKTFIANYYSRYSELKRYQDAVREAVELSRKASDLKTELGYPAGIGEFVSITGRRYVFQEYDAPSFMKERGVYTSFSPTQMKNYPVQGFATGDIVPEVLGRLFRLIYSKPEVRGLLLPINTIHDSILFDCHASIIDRAVPFIKTAMENVPHWMKKRFDLDIDMQFPVDVEIGHDWDNLKHA